jgi:WD40 repeat protein
MRQNLQRVATWMLALALSACGGTAPRATATPVLPTPTAMPTPVPLPALEPITVENAGRVRLLRTLPLPGYGKGEISQCSVAFSPDGTMLAGACGINLLPVWDVASGLVRFELYPTRQQNVACAFAPDGETLATGGFDQTITLWNAVTGALVRELGSHDSPVWELDFSPDGRSLASCALSDDVRAWDVTSGKVIWARRGALGFLSVAFDPLSETIACGSRRGEAWVLDAHTGKEVTELIRLQNPVGDITFSPSGRLLAAGTDDNTIYLWHRDGYERLAILAGHAGFVNGVAFSPDETLLASGSHDKTVGLWDVAKGQRLATVEGHSDAVLRVAFRPDGMLLASISWDGTVRLWGVSVD